MKTWTLLLGLCCTNLIAAGLFQITDREYGDVGQTIGDAVFDELETQINNSLPSASTSTYLPGIANATVLSAGGLDGDHATPYKFVQLRYAAGAGADLGTSSLSDLLSGTAAADTLGGVAGQISMTIGLNFGAFFIGKQSAFLKRFRTYLSFANNSTSVNNFSFNVTTFGLKLQYLAIQPMGTALARWGGVRVGFGFFKSGMDLRLTQALNQSASSSSDSSVSSTFNGTAVVGADVSIVTLPLDVSTYVQFLYVFSVYTGFGFDSAFGTVSSLASLSGDITTSEAGLTGVGSLNLGANASPQSISIRYFAGLQIDLAAINLFLQFNQSITNSTLGLAGGASIYF